MKRYPLRFFGLAILLLAIGCAPTRPWFKPGTTAGAVPAGSEFIIAVAGNATTGYEWNFVADTATASVTLLEKRYEPEEVGSGFAGQGGIYLFRFRARQPGAARLHFENRRPWERDLPAIENSYFYLTIR